MRADRILIGASLFLGVGLWSLFNFCHGTVGMAFALPVAGTKFNMEITTMGVPALVGVPLALIGILLLIAALLAAIVQQFRPSLPRHPEPRHPEPTVPGPYPPAQN